MNRLSHSFVSLALLLLLTLLASPARAATVIQTENAKTTGVTSQWQIPDASYASNQEVEGYASATSVNRGGSIKLFVQTKLPDAAYTLTVYRIGWYGGAGGRQVLGPITRNRTEQPACPLTDPATRLVECNWIDPYTLTVPNSADPTDWASGVYLTKITGATSGRQSYIVFVVRDDARAAVGMFQQSVTTYSAYNGWGGYDFYNTVANKLSFDRPYSNPERHLRGKGAGDFLSWEINTLRFVEREGYDVKYSTNIDTHTDGARLLNVRMFLSTGHDEYYTKQMYDAVENARNNGVNLAFFGSNSIYWQVRLEPNTLTGQPNRTMVGYRYDTDPLAASNPTLATYLWRETARAPINRPEAALIGVAYDYNSIDTNMAISDCSGWICAGANVSSGYVLSGMLGYEVDKVWPSSPAGLQVLTSSPYDACLNVGCTSKERRYGNSSYYTHASGAGVFATGSMQWQWGLDSYTPGPRIATQDEHEDRSNPVVLQITRNVMARFTSVNGNNPPTISSTPVTLAAAGVAYSYDVNATDPNADALTYALTQAPAGMTISAANGLIGWTPTAAQGGAVAVTVRVSDPGGLAATQAYTINVSTTWTRCAGEGGTCTFSGTRLVRFGANGSYVTRTATGSIVCSNGVFGDPLPGVAKQCELADVAAPGTTAAPAFSLPGGSYVGTQTVSLSSATSGAKIYYTTNGSTPTTASAVYSAPISIAATTTLQAIAAASGLSNSSVASATYTISTSSSGWVRCANEGQTCSFSGTRTVRFGANGVYATRTATGSIACATPVFGDPIYGVAKACDYQDSGPPPSTAATPTFSVAPGTYTSAQTVSLASATSGAAIYYTVDGSTPSAASTRYTAPLTIATTTTLQAIATASGLANSAVASGTYTINTGSSGWVRCAGEGQTCTFSGTRTVRFGANGTYATRTATGSIVCSNGVFGDPLPGVAKQCDYQNTVAPPTTAATPVFSLAPGSYVGTQTVSLSSATAGATIYYTTNGSTPTTASTPYTAPISIAQTTTLQAMAVAQGLANSAVVSGTYTITTGGGTWTRCANEGGTCTFSGTRTVRFGANGAYATRTATGSIVCSNTVFGDPAYGVAKACDYQ